MEKLMQLRKQIVTDGVLSAQDVASLRKELFADGGMTKEKGDFLFEFKDFLSKDKITPEFRDLFVDALSALLLEDEDSPGEIDEAEAKWLRARIQLKGYQDRIDHQLLENIRAKSINFPEILNFKSKASRMFENVLYVSRYLTLFAVVGSLLSALALFIRGSVVVVYGLVDFYKTFSLGSAEEYDKLLAAFVSSVDIFLFAMVLIIFGMGIYELFINKIDPVERKADSRPSWLQIRSIDELKSSLGKVILMVLIVSFFKHSLDVSYTTTSDLLYLSVGILLVALSLYIANKQHH